jgi:hypothetical protein
MSDRRLFGSRLGTVDVDEVAPEGEAAAGAILALQRKVRALEAERDALRRHVAVLEDERESVARAVKRLADVLEEEEEEIARVNRQHQRQRRGRVSLPWVSAGPPTATTHSLIAHLQRMEHLLRNKRETGDSGDDDSGVYEALAGFTDSELEAVREKLESEHARAMCSAIEDPNSLERLRLQLQVIRRACHSRRQATKVTTTDGRRQVLQEVRLIEHSLSRSMALDEQ